MLYKTTSNKNINEIVSAMWKKASDYNLIIRNVFNMSQEFKNHGVAVAEDFEYYSVMVCNPSKAYESIKNNPLRGAILLPPKQIVIYKNNNGESIIVYVALEKDDIAKIVPDDNDLQNGLSASGRKIIEFIKNIK